VESNDYGLDQNWLVYRQPKEAINEVGGPDSLKIEESYLQRLDKGDLLLIDESYDARLDYELSYAFGPVTGMLQLGGKYHQLTRTSDGTSRFSNFEWGGSVARRQAFLAMFPWVTTVQGAQRGISAHNFVDPDYDPGTFLDGRYEPAWTGDIDLLTDIQDQWYEGPDDTKYYFRGVESYQRDYEATEKLMAGYIMTEINIGQRLMLLPGVRYEQNKTEYFAYHIVTNDGQTGIEPNPDSVITNRDNSNWFPSLNMKFKITDYLSLQGAAYKSTSRPSFRQISPLVIYRHNSQNITANNPYLWPSTAWNFDLGISLMKSKIGLLTVYGFYKEISDLAFTMNGYKPIKKGNIVGGPDDLDDRLLGEEYFIEYYIDDNQGFTNQPFNNTEKAYVSGLEFSWQTSFWYLPSILKGLVLDVNFSIINTSTKYPYFQEVITDVDNSGWIPIYTYGQEYRTRRGPMEDQPASILNVIVGWDFKGFSSRVSYRFQDKTVNSLDTRYSVFDAYYDTFSLIDVMLKQKITDNISAYANLTNIGNHVDDYYYGEQEDKPALPTNSQFYGFRAQVGVRVNL
jgi:TonB-dependent receptor